MILRLLRLCDALLEIGWLFAIVAIPIYFNVDDVRAFGPDKAILLRDVAALLVVLALVRLTLRSRAGSYRHGNCRLQDPRRPGDAHAHGHRSPPATMPAPAIAADESRDPTGLSRHLPYQGTGYPPGARLPGSGRSSIHLRAWATAHRR